MCLKLIVWALTWEQLIARGKRAIKDIEVHGVKTTIPYHQQILNSGDFTGGSFNTGFVEAHPELVEYSTKLNKGEIAAAVGAVIAAHLQL